jgi:hypothetical protein
MLVLWATAVHADIVPRGYQSVRSSIRVEAEVPAGKALVLANTFRGADVLQPGATAPVAWHPLHGPMRLVLVDAKDVPALAAARTPQSREQATKITDRGISCGEPFQGVRTVPATSPVREIRWIYRVAAAGGTCQATLLLTEELDDAGRPVSGADAAAPADGAASADSPASTGQPASTAPPGSASPSPAAAPPPKSGCGACTVGRDGDRGGAWGWIVGAAALGVARRRGHRTSRR